jgi:hypothetical protein
MTTQEIEQREWSGWLGLLSRLGQGHRARVEVEELDVGDQELAEVPLPFLGVDFDSKGSSRGIDLLLESPPGDTFSHHIDRPERIYAVGDGTSISVVEIESAGGKLILYLEPPVDFAVGLHAP